MSESDQVYLILVIAPDNHIPIQTTRGFAHHYMTYWHKKKSEYNNKSWFKRLCGPIIHYGRSLPCIYTVIYEDKTSFITAAIDGRLILGMYVREIDSSAQLYYESYKKLTDAQTKLAESMNKEINKGEEWRGDDEDDD